MVVLEVCVDTVESAVAAGNGGAHRIELCSCLREGGLTPSIGLFQLIRRKFHTYRIRAQINVMIRCRQGDFVYSDDEVELMASDINLFKSFGVDGFVFGCLTPDGKLDENANRTLIESALPLPCTLHRAFDLCQDPLETAQKAVEVGFQRILTSGQKKTALKGLPLLQTLQREVGDNIIIMPGCGINVENVSKFVKDIEGLKEIHSSASSIKKSKMSYTPNVVFTEGTRPPFEEFNLKITNEEIVRALINVIPRSLFPSLKT